MKHSRRILTLILLTCWLVAFETLASPLKVGVILPLSGQFTTAGEGIRNGIELALSEMTPEERSLIELRFEDDQFQPKLTVSAFKKLVEQDHVDLVVNSSAPTGWAIASLSTRAAVPFISISSDRRMAASGENIFLFWVTPEAIAAVAAHELAQSGIQNLWRISSQNEGRRLLDSAIDDAAGKKIKILKDEQYPLDARDFRTFLTQLQNAPKIDGVLVNLFFGQVGLFAKQARELGIKAPIYGFEMMGDPLEQGIAAGALQGATYFSDFRGSSSFVEKYRSHFPSASIFAAGNGYEIVKLALDMAKANLRGKEVTQYLNHLKVRESVFGTISMGSDRRMVLPAASHLVE